MLAQTLNQATNACNAANRNNGQPGLLMANTAYTNLHYGNLITYLRLLELKPPSN